MTEDPLPKKVVILYSDAKREYFPTEQQYISEAEVKIRAQMIALYLNKMGIKTALVPGNSELSENIKKNKPDFVINLVDSVYGQENLSGAIPGMLELLNIPYTGCGMNGSVLNNDKYLTKDLLLQYGITTPKYQLIKDPSDEIDPVLDYPLISKLNTIHGSVEMDETAVSDDEKSLYKRIDYLMKTYNQPILIEEYIEGKEVSVVVNEGVNTKLYAAQKIFDTDLYASKNKIVNFESKWNDSDDYEDGITYEKYELSRKVKESLKEAFEILKMADYARFDLRVDESGRHYIIDCNANPAMGVGKVDKDIEKQLSKMLNKSTHSISRWCTTTAGTILELHGISFEDFLKRLIKNTFQNVPSKLNKKID